MARLTNEDRVTEEPNNEQGDVTEGIEDERTIDETRLSYLMSKRTRISHSL